MLTRSPVLVLNQNYQPLNVCDARRAMSLLGRGKAETIEEGPHYLHSATRIFPLPEVIRLIYMVKRPIHRRKLSRREVFIRDSYRCQYCGKNTRDLTLDHVVPRSRGGLHTWQNVASACKRCNHRKAGRTPREANMTLRTRPREPAPSPYAFFDARRMLATWRPFLPWVQEFRFTDDRGPNSNGAQIAARDQADYAPSRRD